ncbi:tRNA (guanosine(37)-N1)-methyltransferase TrmD [Acanthopleuribacter pedis]|uniref:tRNA (guanine-N(1)-)-methyltransferase n=1 Tax=Acanthopleuribacter pedis TaxID=442870 RepID=A0A8J7U304_9BACT|nr:tRNA (guanosine(37)-N1)-methyltransferase TrmD [Acanthopleuribacter pedis]MBO1319863.1 tRNA (guanosine(37)-N1)-methyltransferase TrmD [Acanthopleuribacter pedis]
MRIDCISIFPQIIADALAHSIPGRAQAGEQLSLHHHDLRAFTTDKHQKVDDIPYGGGVGMVFKPEPATAAIRAVKAMSATENRLVIHPSPAAPPLTQKAVNALAQYDQLIFIASRYEGLDQRVIDQHVDREYSIGDFVISGGELACAVMIDAVSRQIPGVVAKKESVEQDSYYDGLLDYPHYTRPAVFEEQAIPDELRSGHHEQIRIWRKKQALQRTLDLRPDLLETAALDKEAVKLLRSMGYRAKERS